MPRKRCLTKGCKSRPRSRGLCDKCRSALRQIVNQGRLTLPQAVELGLILPVVPYSVRVSSRKTRMERAVEAALREIERSPGQLPAPPIRRPPDPSRNGTQSASVEPQAGE